MGLFGLLVNYTVSVISVLMFVGVMVMMLWVLGVIVLGVWHAVYLSVVMIVNVGSSRLWAYWWVG